MVGIYIHLSLQVRFTYIHNTIHSILTHQLKGDQALSLSVGIPVTITKWNCSYF